MVRRRSCAVSNHEFTYAILRDAARRCAAPQDEALPQAPTHLFRKALEKLGLIGPFRRLPHAFVEAVGVVADQNAPAFGLDAIEDDAGGLGGGGRRLLKEAAGAFGHGCLNV